MIIFASTLRINRRPRRISTVASLLRALSTVQVTVQPDGWSPCSAPALQPASRPVIQTDGTQMGGTSGGRLGPADPVGAA